MAATALDPGAAHLVIETSGRPDVHVRLEREQYRLGRSSANDLTFPEDQKLSREHLVFVRDSNGWSVQDVGSRNGSQLNGVKLEGTVYLAPGDRVKAGHLSIRFYAGSGSDGSQLNHITFVDLPLDGTGTVAVDLKAALEMTGDAANRPVLENEHLGALVRAGRELAGHGSIETLCRLVLDLSLDTVKASRGVVMTVEREGIFKVRATRGDGLRISNAVRNLVIDGGKSLLIPDARLDQIFANRASIVTQEIRSILAVPLQTDERVIGLLYLDSPHLIRPFTAEDLNLVTVMANIAAIRIEQARLIEHEQATMLLTRDLERAAEIQRRLLPAKAPEIAGFDLAGYNAPCRTVGGDYYDFLTYPDGRVLVLIGDVSGKGLGAALLMSSVQARVQVLFEDPEPLATRVCRLNRSIAANCPGNCFITFFAAVLDPATGDLVYCNAGHNPPLLVRVNDEVENLEGTGLPLGIMRDAAYEQKSCRLESGDALVLFSDGVTEASVPDTEEEFGEQRLISTIRCTRNGTAASMIEAINAEVFAFAGDAPAADDVTVVVARRY